MRGPQHEVKPAASSYRQCGSRAEEITVKATSAARNSESVRAAAVAGVLGAARSGDVMRNVRDPSGQPSSGQVRSYQSKAKSSGAQRESEGAVVPLMAATNNTAGGKGPCFGQAGKGGKREGMAETARPNNPGGREPIDKVRRLQRKLWTAAKQHPSRRFHAVNDPIHRRDVLWNAWECVWNNRVAVGVEGVALAAVYRLTGTVRYTRAAQS